MSIPQEILDWSEVWALLIPLSVLVIKRKQPAILKPIIIYIVAALLLNFIIDYTWKIINPERIKPDRIANNIFYNLHSIVRMISFSWFFILLNQRFLHNVKKILPFIFFTFAVINFIFFESVHTFSSRLHATEAALLLFYCLQYYLFILQDEQHSTVTQPTFWIVTGLAIYVAINFFIFLFYEILTVKSKGFAASLWNVHNISYIIFCLFIAKGFYESKQ